MTIMENYKKQMNGKGIGLLEFYMWVFCTFLAIYNTVKIIRIFAGSLEFEGVDFTCTLIVAMASIIVVATAILLDKITFWCCLIPPMVSIAINVIGTVQTVIEAVQAAKDVPLLTALLEAGIVLDILFLFIDIAVCGIFILYLVEHRVVFGYSNK